MDFFSGVRKYVVCTLIEGAGAAGRCNRPERERDLDRAHLLAHVLRHALDGAAPQVGEQLRTGIVRDRDTAAHARAHIGGDLLHGIEFFRPRHGNTLVAVRVIDRQIDRNDRPAVLDSADLDRQPFTVDPRRPVTGVPEGMSSSPAIIGSSSRKVTSPPSVSVTVCCTAARILLRSGSRRSLPTVLKPQFRGLTHSRAKTESGSRGRRAATRCYGAPGARAARKPCRKRRLSDAGLQGPDRRSCSGRRSRRTSPAAPPAPPGPFSAPAVLPGGVPVPRCGPASRALPRFTGGVLVETA